MQTMIERSKQLCSHQNPPPPIGPKALSKRTIEKQAAVWKNPAAVGTFHKAAAKTQPHNCALEIEDASYGMYGKVCLGRGPRGRGGR